MNKQSNLSIEQQATLYNYLTVNLFCEEYKAFKPGGIRALIFNADSNGLAKAGGVVRVGKKVLLNVPKFFDWVQSQGQGGAK